MAERAYASGGSHLNNKKFHHPEIKNVGQFQFHIRRKKHSDEYIVSIEILGFKFYTACLSYSQARDIIDSAINAHHDFENPKAFLIALLNRTRDTSSWYTDFTTYSKVEKDKNAVRTAGFCNYIFDYYSDTATIFLKYGDRYLIIENGTASFMSTGEAQQHRHWGLTNIWRTYPYSSELQPVEAHTNNPPQNKSSHQATKPAAKASQEGDQEAENKKELPPKGMLGRVADYTKEHPYTTAFSALTVVAAIGAGIYYWRSNRRRAAALAAAAPGPGPDDSDSSDSDSSVAIPPRPEPRSTHAGSDDESEEELSDFEAEEDEASADDAVAIPGAEPEHRGEDPAAIPASVLGEAPESDEREEEAAPAGDAVAKPEACAREEELAEGSEDESEEDEDPAFHPITVSRRTSNGQTHRLLCRRGLFADRGEQRESSRDARDLNRRDYQEAYSNLFARK